MDHTLLAPPKYCLWDAQTRFCAFLGGKIIKKLFFNTFWKLREKMAKKYFLTFFHDFELKFWIFFRKKPHFGQKSLKFVIFRSSWTHTSVGKHPMTIIFSFTHSPRPVLQPKKISWPYDFHGRLYEFFAEKNPKSGKVQVTLEKGLNVFSSLRDPWALWEHQNMIFCRKLMRLPIFDGFWLFLLYQSLGRALWRLLLYTPG